MDELTLRKKTPSQKILHRRLLFRSIRRFVSMLAVKRFTSVIQQRFSFRALGRRVLSLRFPCLRLSHTTMHFSGIRA